MAVTSRDALAEARSTMVSELVERRGIYDRRVLQSMNQVPRHLYVDETLRSRAYGPYTLPIGGGQSMPHPHTVGVMLNALQLRGKEHVLEIGSGSGYQTALLCDLAEHVWSTERLPLLQQQACQRLEQQHIGNVHFKATSRLTAFGRRRFDAIHVSAAAPEVPGALLSLLQPAGRLVLPVGRSPHQRLLLLRLHDGYLQTQSLGACRFAPLLG